MKINRKNPQIKVSFGALIVGECFEYDENLYIKIRNFKEGLTTDEQIDAFNCDTNCVAVIFNDALVELKTMELNEV